MSPRFLEGNRLTLLRNGAEYFPALENSIRNARHEIYLETYLYEDDATGQRVTDALCEAARRGVRVHVLVDGFGAKDMPQPLRARLLEAQVRFLVFRPNISLRLRRHRLRRMHRKVAVTDGRVAFVGGINVIDDTNTPDHAPPRYDYAVLVEGPLVRPIHAEVEKLWRLVSWVNLRRRRKPGQGIALEDAPKGDQRAALVIRDNFHHRSDIEDAYLEAFASAREEIILANAYFFPGKRFRRALVQAARRGVRVVLLLQGRVEFILLHFASRALYGMLLDAGIELHEYHKGFMHAKVAVIDGHWATVGSSNIDPFSLMLAREANLVVEDRKFAADLRDSLQAALANGAAVMPKKKWSRKPLWQRTVIWSAYGVVRFLMGMVGYGGGY